jgi:2',3'-cyclic-nucleotide 2'-phosphodiesterase (5'-nucleotidase family)
MKRRSAIFSGVFFAIVFFVSCKTIYQPQSVTHVAYRLNQSSKQDSNLIKWLQPYADSVNKSMNTIIAVAETELDKKQPEGTLGNVMADAMLAKAKQAYKLPVHAAFINHGGIRLGSVPAGNITIGKVFELAPFDNDIVIQKISGTILQQFLDHISAKGGWPVAGITWQIKNKRAVNVLVNGQPFNQAGEYSIAMVDYVANGGDDCAMLRPVAKQSIGIVLRDALIAWLVEQTKEGKKISAKIENRVSNAE